MLKDGRMKIQSQRRDVARPIRESSPVSLLEALSFRVFEEG